MLQLDIVFCYYSLQNRENKSWRKSWVNVDLVSKLLHSPAADLSQARRRSVLLNSQGKANMTFNKGIERSNQEASISVTPVYSKDFHAIETGTNSDI